MATLNVHQYSVRPAQVTAVQVTDKNLGEIANWTGGVLHRHTREHEPCVIVDDHMLALTGSWVVRELGGKFLVLSNEEFAAHYAA